MPDPLLDIPPLATPRAGAQRKCRVCGCTEARACVVDPEFGPCWWLEDDLCSYCGEPAIVATHYLQLLAQRGVMPDPTYGRQLELWSRKGYAALLHASTTPPESFLL